jgi:hypothetical protein
MDALNSVAAAGTLSAGAERTKNIDRFLLALIFALFVVWTYLLPPIWNHGEAREGLVVQDIVRDHEWVLQFSEGAPSKPPLFSLDGAAALVFGLSDITVRLPSAVPPKMVAATFVLGKSIGAAGQPGSRSAPCRDV